jgi:hypothetical protein
MVQSPVKKQALSETNIFKDFVTMLQMAEEDIANIKKIKTGRLIY